MTARVGIFHPGRQHSWQTVLAVQQAAALGWFATALFYDAKRMPYRLERVLPRPLRGQAQRYFAKIANADIDPAAVRIVGALEWLERAAAKLGWLRAADLLNNRGNRKFQAGVIALQRREPVDVLWGYDTSCADVFAAARPGGTVCVLDRSIGHPAALRRILERESEQFSEFFVGRLGLPNQAAIVEANREMALADHFVVGSQFCGDTLIEAGARREQIHIVPYGFDVAAFPDRPVRPALGTLPIRFVFVGSVSPRKGIHHLLQAFARIPRDQAQLTVVGPLSIPRQAMVRYAERVDFLGPLAPAEVARQLSQAHCFILPSLFEGSSVALCEAIAAGLGIIQSYAAGDGVQQTDVGPNGVVLPLVSADTIVAAVEQLIAQPHTLRDWSEASWSLRPQRSWQVYRQRVAELLPRLIEKGGAGAG